MALSRFVLPFADVGSGIRPSSGAKLFFFETGTSTPADTFNCPDGTTANSNPVISDSKGLFPDIFFSGVFKVILKDKNDVQIWEADPVSSELQLAEAASVAELRTLEPNTSGQQINLLGHTNPGKGGGVFYFDASDTTSPDNNGTIIVTTLGARWKRQIDDFATPEMYGALRDGVTDDFQAIQDVADNHLRVVYLEGRYGVGSTVLIHDRAGLYWSGAGEDATTFIPLTTLLLDPARITALGLDHATQYERNALFMITEFDGENNRPDFAARNHRFENFAVFMDGTPSEDITDAFSSPNLAHTQWGDIKVSNALGFYHGWIFADDTGRQFHLVWDNCRSIDNVHHVYDDFLTTSITSNGTTWLLTNNSLTRCQNGYEIHGINYATLDSCSVDNNAQGSYAIDINSCSGITIISPGVETRLEQAGPGFGGGIFKAVNSSGVCDGAFWVGGDRDGIGATGTIADYGVTDSLLVLDGSIFDVNNMMGDWVIAPAGPAIYYPFFLSNGSTLRYNQGLNVFGDNNSDFTVNDTSACNVARADGEQRLITATNESISAFYETGTFTPVLADASSGGNEATAGAANGTFTKIGNSVTVSIDLTNIDTTGLTGANNVFITGLPFAAVSKTGFIRYTSNFISIQIAFTGNPMATIEDNTNFLTLIEVNSGSFLSNVIVSDLTSGTADLYITISYEIE